MFITSLRRAALSVSVLLVALIATTQVVNPIKPAPAIAKAATCTVAEVSAHRGNWDGRYAENGRNAFRYTQNKYAAAWWETDVDVVDGEFVIRHDPSAPVRMTFEELLNDMAVDGVQAFVELKFVPTDDQWDSIISMIDQYNLRSKIVLTSFVGQTMLAAESKAANIRRGLIASTGYQTAASITQYHVQYYIKHSDSITYSRAMEWIGAGLKLAAWSDHLDNEPTEWKRMNDDKVVNVITNTGGAYVAWAAGQGCTLSKR